LDEDTDRQRKTQTNGRDHARELKTGPEKSIERNRSSSEVTQENGISTAKQAPRSISAKRKNQLAGAGRAGQQNQIEENETQKNSA
jgi:hypothetical protein